MTHRQAAQPRPGLLHRIFEASLLLKGVMAAVEAAAGAALLVTRHEAVTALIGWLARTSLLEGPHEPLAARFIRATSHFDASAQHFYAVYLAGHGLMKLVIVVLLALRIAAAYPIALAAFGGFIAYQMHRYWLTGSPMMLLLSGFDLVLILLTWREWRMARR